MIRSLTIKNFILVDYLKLEFEKGFNVLTGQTGSGKSIIINSIDACLGSKIVNKNVIKKDTQKAYVEICFELDKDFNFDLLSQNGIELDKNESEIIISREITFTSSRFRLNGYLINADLVKLLRESLLDIHSQHQSYTYLQSKYHIVLLDGFINQKISPIINDYKLIYKQYKETKKKLIECENSRSMSQSQIEFLRFEIEEIDQLEIEDLNEDEKLREKIDIYSNSEKLKKYVEESYYILHEQEMNVLDLLSKVKSNISQCSRYDDNLASYENEIQNCYLSLKEISSQLNIYKEKIDIDENTINGYVVRLDALNRIKRKHNKLSLSEVLDYRSKMSEELEKIEFSEENIENLRKCLSSIENRLKEKSIELSTIRREYALKLSRIMEEELERLELPKVSFKVEVKESVGYNENGKDVVEFLISTNVSQSLMPLNKVASGGEISRVMLALKSVFAKCDNISTVIFDEIDTGISGSASESVALSMSKLSNSHQLICITHQPIIAAKADVNFYVVKSQKETTKVFVKKLLTQQERTKAIAFLARGSITEESLNFAKELVSLK